MPDTLGTIPVPEVTPSSSFPLSLSFPYTTSIDYKVVTHRFHGSNQKLTQRFKLGTGAQKFHIGRRRLSFTETNSLKSFWEGQRQSYGAFTFLRPSPDGSTSPITCRFEHEPLSLSALRTSFASDLTLVEIPTSTPAYTTTATETRFPSSTLQTRLLSQVQEIVPLVTIQSNESGYPLIRLSNRRCTVDGSLYLPRLLSFDTITQSIGSDAEDVQFTLGNADHVITLLSQATLLDAARITFSFLVLDSPSAPSTSGILLNFWSGDLLSLEDKEGEPSVRIRASDPIRDLRLSYPPRRISRTCWKTFNGSDGMCPWAAFTSSTLDTTHYPSASPSTCDKGYDTPNGCLAHKMERHFGGIPARPQGVTTRDNSTGTWGFRRSPLTSTSIIRDTAYDEVIPHVFCSTQYSPPLRVNAKILSVRDEGDFVQALAIACAGPVTFNPSGHSLDNSYHHGHPSPLGLRLLPGTDPAGATDYLSLDQSGDQTGGDHRKVYSSPSTFDKFFAAGVAALSIRKSDTKGLQPTRPEEHTVQFFLDNGMQGWTWTAGGTRQLATITNPIWAFANAILHSSGLFNASDAQQKELLDTPSFYTASSFCDALVNKVSGFSGQEPRFRFRAIIQEEKPLKDWGDEILSCCLGYWTTVNGKIRVGIRSNATAVESFGDGNIVVDSLSSYPRRASFNMIRGVYSDEDFDGEGNQVDWYDLTHATLRGRNSGPSYSRADKNFIGVPSLSQCYRLLSVLGKEELGGTTPSEWAASRHGSFTTTILSLNCEPGMVIQITRPKYTGKARITSWSLNPDDLSVTINYVSVTDSMYNDLQGPQFAGTPPSLTPYETYSQPSRPSWGPAIITPPSPDPVFGSSSRTFQLRQRYTTSDDGTVLPSLILSGRFGANLFHSVPQPRIPSVSTSPSGGFLPSTIPVFLQVVPYTGNGSGAFEELKFGPPSNIVAVETPSSPTSSVLLSNIVWPQPPTGLSWGGFLVLSGRTEQRMYQAAIVVGSMPTSFTLTVESPTGASSVSAGLRGIIARAKVIAHAGIAHGVVTAVTSSTITVDAFIGSSWSATSRVISILSGQGEDTPTVSLTCTGYNSSTGTLSFSSSPTAAGILPGDYLVVRARAALQPDNLTVIDFSWGLPPASALKGYILRIIGGTGAGQSRVIGFNTSSTVTVDSPWTTAPDLTSVFIIEEAAWTYGSPAFTGDSFASARTVELEVPISNIAAFFLAAGFTIDKDQLESSDADTPMREVYVRGEQFDPSIASNYTVGSNDRYLLVDTTAGDIALTLPPPSTRIGKPLRVKKKAGAGVLTTTGGIITTITDSVELYSNGTEYVELIGGSGGGGGGSAEVYPHTVTLSSSPGGNVVSAPISPSAAKILLLKVVQSTPPQSAVTWHSDFMPGTANITPDAGDASRFIFVSEGGKWWLYNSF